MATIKPPTKAQIDAQQARKQQKLINVDIAKIDAVLQEHNYENAVELHRNLDGKYQSCIEGWAKGLYGYNSEYGMSYELAGEEAIFENLKTMKPKLEAFAQGRNARGHRTATPPVSNVNVTVNNTVNLELSFQQAKDKVEDMTGLTDEQAAEIHRRIDELEEINKETIPKRKKWEKVKPIIAFILDKGADAAIAIMTLVLQMNLGA